MPKFDINASRYAKFFESRDASNALSVLINNPDIIKMNYGFWRTKFTLPTTTEQGRRDGLTPFVAKMKVKNAPGMLSVRAPLGGSSPRDKQGVEIYTGSIPDLIADGYVETAMEREDKQRMLEEYFGNDAFIVSNFADDIQVLIDEGNQSMNYMAAQAMTKKTIVYDKGKGASITLNNAPIPDENFKKAGEVVWSDPSCKLISQMQKIEEEVKAQVGEDIPFVWDMPLDIFRNVFLKNAEVIEYVKNWRKLNDRTYTDTMTINEQMFNEAFADNDIISPVVVSKESEYDGGSVIKGWASGAVTYHPAGFVGTVRKASLLDAVMFNKYGSSAISKVFANVDIFTIVNTTLNNGELKEWHTDLLLSAFPCLEEWAYHFVIDTTTAD